MAASLLHARVKDHEVVHYLKESIHAWVYGPQGTLYASLFPTRIRYTGLSTVYQLSGIYGSALTPLILTSLIAAGHDAPWYACGYLVATAVLSVGATVLLNPR